MPVFLAHGRSDPVLPFAVAERFRAKLEAAGVRVTWVPFDGGHEIPAAVIIALNTFSRPDPSRRDSEGIEERQT